LTEEQYTNDVLPLQCHQFTDTQAQTSGAFFLGDAPYERD
jgi:hypothetical protein